MFSPLAKAVPAFCLLVLAAPTLANEYTCADPAGEVTLGFTRAHDATTGTFSITAAETQIDGDIGYGAGDDPRNGGTITFTNVQTDPWRTEFDFHLTDAASGYDNAVASVHVFSHGEGNQQATAGVLTIVAGGAWPVICEIVEAQ